MADPLARSPATRRKPTPAAVPALRLAQLVRRPSPAAASEAGTVTIEVGGATITIGAGADMATVVMVLALLGGRA
jgi:hypothetical protein